MGLLFGSFWRALANCLHPRVIGWSLLPLGVMVVLTLLVGWLLWEPAVEGVRSWLDSSTLISGMSTWLGDNGVPGLKGVVAPLIVAFAVTPLVAIGSLLLVLMLIGQALSSFVAGRRFTDLDRRGEGSWLGGVLWALGSTLLALLVLLVSSPLWLIPPLVLILPPLIWGWLAYRVLAYDALSIHATGQERRELMKTHRLTMLGMGVVCGYIGSAPGLVWAFGAGVLIPFFVLLAPFAIWIYTFAFAFCALWFAHFSLQALQDLRANADRTPKPGSGAEIIEAQTRVFPSNPAPAQSAPTLPPPP